MRVTATSAASPSSSASAQVTVTSDIGLVVSPGTASVELGAKQGFAVTLSSSGQPDNAIRWSVSGAACPSACGSVDANGNYTAPSILPAPASVTVTAQSVADPSKQASAPVTITSHFSLQLAAPASLATSATAALVATFTPVPGSNPSSILSWSVSGAGCSGSSCGTLSAASTQYAGASTTSGSDAESANYTAPTAAPQPPTVIVTVTPQADPSKQASATISVAAGTRVTLNPAAATVTINHRVTLSAAMTGTPGSTVNWAVNGIPGGNSTVGQICVANVTPCSPVSGNAPAQVDFLAPGSPPSPNPATVQAAIASDASKFAASQITVINHDVVSVLPNSVTMAPGAIQQFSASVLGTPNQSVVWQLQGADCSTTGACGSVASDGTYTAPATPPSPNTLQVVAVSSDDTTQSASASVLIAAGAHIEALHPASVYAGAANGFVLRVDGGGFIPSSPGPGSALLIGGGVRTTTCASNGECTAPVFAADVAGAGSVTVQLQNPDGSRSNSVLLIVAAPNVSDASASLASNAGTLSGQDIVVVEPTTAGISTLGNDLDLNVAALGNFSAANNSCTLAGNPIVLVRPAAGAVTADICLFSEAGLDTSMTYTITGDGDMSVLAKQPAGLGIIHLTLQLSAAAQPGARTLFIQNPNLDKTAASGVLEIQ